MKSAESHAPSDATGASALQNVIGQLEADIISGRLQPHQELVEDALMARFGSKRHVVRSAIQTLASRQLVVKPRGKSARVKDFTAREVEEIYHMRALLQQEAARIMPLPAAPDALNALKEIHVRYSTAVSIGADPLLIYRLNNTFHQTLFALCEHQTLCRAIEFYTQACTSIRSCGVADENWLKRAVAEHEDMIRAIENQDREGLASLVVEHMQPTRRRWESLHLRGARPVLSST